MRLIDADVLLKEWRLECGGSCYIRKDKYCMHYDRTKGVCTLIIKAPTVEPIKHGRWIIEPDAEVMDCSVCDWVFEYYSGLEEEWNHCPNCGAIMDLTE